MLSGANWGISPVVTRLMVFGERTLKARLPERTEPWAEAAGRRWGLHWGEAEIQLQVWVRSEVSGVAGGH